MDWSRGYFASNEYTYGHYVETMPTRLSFAALLHGVIAQPKGFRYLDLGCGQGFNLIIAASLHPDSHFVGVDFMPEHIHHARHLATLAGLTNVEFVEADFVALAEDSGQIGADYDYAVAHGISTWISPEARSALYRIVGNTLKPNGVFYNSYNTLPGWLSVFPFQHMVLKKFESESGVDALKSARVMFDRLKAANSPLFHSLPTLGPRLERLADQDPSYLLQEYNNKHWQPAWVSHVIHELSQHKLTYLGTSTLSEAFDQNYPPGLRAEFEQAKDATTRELARDIAVNQSFRRDLYVKGKGRAWPIQIADTLRQTGVCVNPFRALPQNEDLFVFSTGILEVKGLREPYMKLIDAVKATKSQSLSIEELSSNSGTPFLETVQMASLLVHSGWFGLTGANVKESVASAHKLNKAILQQVLKGAPYRFLASPGTGVGLNTTEIEMVMLATREHASAEKKHIAEIGKHLRLLGRALLKEGKPIQDESEIEETLLKQQRSFMAGMGMWTQVGVI
jgi:SAM-dependent methyltransferase